MKEEPVKRLSLEDSRIVGMAPRRPGYFQVHACEDQRVYLFLAEPNAQTYSEVLTFPRGAAEHLVLQLQDALRLLD